MISAQSSDNKLKNVLTLLRDYAITVVYAVEYPVYLGALVANTLTLLLALKLLQFMFKILASLASNTNNLP